MSERDLSGGATIGTVRCDAGGLTMGEWLINDVSFLDVHIQLWMLLVTGIILGWLVYAWATR